MQLSLEAQQLLVRKKQAQKTSDYLLADQLNRKYKQLIRFQYKQKLQQARHSHKQMLEQMDATQAQKIEQYKVDDQRMLQKYMDDRYRREEEMLRRQQEEINQFLEDANVSVRPYRKQQSEILELKKQEKQMVRVENYIEAHNIKMKIQELEEQREEAHRILKERKIMVLIEQLKSKHKNQLNVQRQKTQQGIKQREKARQLHLEHMHQKYLNVKQQILLEQAVIMTKLQKNKPKEDGKPVQVNSLKNSTSSSKLLMSMSPRNKMK